MEFKIVVHLKQLSDNQRKIREIDGSLFGNSPDLCKEDQKKIDS